MPHETTASGPFLGRGRPRDASCAVRACEVCVNYLLPACIRNSALKHQAQQRRASEPGMLLPRTKRTSHPHMHPTRAHTHTFGRVRHDENRAVARARAELHDAVDSVERQPSGLGPVFLFFYVTPSNAMQTVEQRRFEEARERVKVGRGGGGSYLAAWRTMATRSEPWRHWSRRHALENSRC